MSEKKNLKDNNKVEKISSSKNINIRSDSETWEKLKRISSNLNISQGDFIKELIKNYEKSINNSTTNMSIQKNLEEAQKTFEFSVENVSIEQFRICEWGIKYKNLLCENPIEKDIMYYRFNGICIYSNTLIGAIPRPLVKKSINRVKKDFKIDFNEECVHSYLLHVYKRLNRSSNNKEKSADEDIDLLLCEQINIYDSDNDEYKFIFSRCRAAKNLDELRKLGKSYATEFEIQNIEYLLAKRIDTEEQLNKYFSELNLEILT